MLVACQIESGTKYTRWGPWDLTTWNHIVLIILFSITSLLLPTTEWTVVFLLCFRLSFLLLMTSNVSFPLGY
jgi:hypothetical protein